MQKGIKTILIDDDDINNFIIKKIYKQLGIEEYITIFKDGRDALRHICDQDDSKCIILLDLHMPQFSGIDFLNEYKKLNKENHEIIVVSNLFKENDKEQLLESGISEVLLKPLKKEFISDLMAKMCEASNDPHQNQKGT